MLNRLDLLVRLVCSSSLGVTGRKTGMLIDLCQAFGARVLRVGAGGSLRYLDRDGLAQAGIDIEVVRFTYLPYQQGRRQREFVSGLSALDLLAHLGPQAARRVIADSVRIERHTPDLLPQR
ncbi:MAG: WbqC family protein [Egibacteraceae bacterium]